MPNDEINLSIDILYSWTLNQRLKHRLSGFTFNQLTRMCNIIDGKDEFVGILLEKQRSEVRKYLKSTISYGFGGEEDIEA